LGDRDGVRTPMQWSPDRNAGFSSANPQQLYLPVILDPAYSYESVNVELQRANTSSLFWFMKRIINMRRNYPAFSRGATKFIPADNPKILAFTRSYKDENILVIANLSKHSQPAEIDLKTFKGYVPVEAFSKNHFPLIKEGSPYFFTLSGHSFQWFILQKKGDDLFRSLPALELEQWNAFTQSTNLQTFQKEILPLYLQNKKWFKGKDRSIYHISVAEHVAIPLPQSPALLLLVEVTYESGLPELYQLAVTFATAEKVKKTLEHYPEAIIVNMKVGTDEGALCDAFFIPQFQQFLFEGLIKKQSFSGGQKGIYFNNGIDGQQYVHREADMPVKMNVVDENNTSIVYDNKVFLKMYRKVDYGPNPDFEVSVYLEEQKRFSHIPRFIGTVELSLTRGNVVLGMMQEMVENHGNGHTYMLERTGNYIERILARDRLALDPAQRIGSFSAPVSFNELPANLQILVGARAAEQARMLGVRTGEMHRALGFDSHLKEFVAEEFSLHYQRSLFSSMLSGVRRTYQNLFKRIDALPAFIKKDAAKLIDRKEDIVKLLKRIYAKKLDVQKIRIHGSFELEKILLTGKDLVIQDFGGNTARSYSERRLKRSPVIDLADMISSMYDVAYEGFFLNNQVPAEDINSLLPFAEQWAFFMSSFFMNAYQHTVKEVPFIPVIKEEREMFLQTFLLEKAIHQLDYELTNRPDRVIVPLRLILSLVR
ncbi:MAG TPA: alpha-glucosidase C-terminal domain-containing protein, partial [Flavisolibacter sp.]|nr:alpha-glucosidase C-terminal domain-containing protein [Flavisolibacter sp.]